MQECKNKSRKIRTHMLDTLQILTLFEVSKIFLSSVTDMIHSVKYIFANIDPNAQSKLIDHKGIQVFLYILKTVK
jgi:hypothetical protein